MKKKYLLAQLIKIKKSKSRRKSNKKMMRKIKDWKQRKRPKKPMIELEENKMSL